MSLKGDSYFKIRPAETTEGLHLFCTLLLSKAIGHMFDVSLRRLGKCTWEKNEHKRERKICNSYPYSLVNSACTATNISKGDFISNFVHNLVIVQAFHTACINPSNPIYVLMYKLFEILPIYLFQCKVIDLLVAVLVAF